MTIADRMTFERLLSRDIRHDGNAYRAIVAEYDKALAIAGRLEQEAVLARAALRDFCDLAPRVLDDDPIAPALRAACRTARAILAQVDGDA